MKNHESEQSPPVVRSGGFVSYVVIAILTLIILVLLGIFFFAPETVTRFSRSSFDASGQQNTQNGERASGGGGDAGSSAGSIELAETELADQSMTADGRSPGGPRRAGDQGRSGTARGGMSGSETSLMLANNIDAFFTTLDGRDYIQDFQLEVPSSVYFPALIQKLVDSPPVVSGETDDLFTILQNTAHFFRILGKRNILILKGILDRERDTFEQTLADFYLLTDDPAGLKERFDITIGEDELYAYAGFFLNTMGGRLYLFRRDSMSRMVVNYYAIQIIDQANKEGRNKYGIDIKDAINNLIVEIESSRIDLKLRDEYLDQLYDLKETYQ